MNNRVWIKIDYVLWDRHTRRRIAHDLLTWVGMDAVQEIVCRVNLEYINKESVETRKSGCLLRQK